MDMAKTGSQVLNKPTSYSLWILIELALIASDTQEILGAAWSLNILFGLNLWAGVVVCAIITIGILMMQRVHQKWFEWIFGFL